MGKKNTKDQPHTSFGLTNSKINKVMMCGFAYDCHYNKKIRPSQTSSSLVFGAGIDAALNSLLTKSGSPIDEYRLEVAKTPLGKMKPSKYDWDAHSLTNFDRKLALDRAKELGYKGNAIFELDDLFNKLYDLEKPNKKQKLLFDILARISLERKAKIMIDAYEKQVLPKIKKVISVQESFSEGILDLQAVWEDGQTYIIDNKTSAFQYDESAPDYSLQLTMYATHKGVENVMFVVIPKRFEITTKKVCTVCANVSNSSHRTCNATIDGVRCGGKWKVTTKSKAKIQFVPGKVTPLMRQRAKEIKEAAQAQIDSGKFTCNPATCGNQFGRPCEYRDAYWKDDWTGFETNKKDK